MITSELMKKIRRIEITTRRLVSDSFAGEYQSVFKGQGMEFHEVRPYLSGDEIRTIDWNVTARMGTPFVRVYREERELTVLVMVDASASSDFGSKGRLKRDLSAELTAVLAFAATTNNDKVGLLIFTDEVELVILPKKGRSHVLRIVREMLVFRPEREGTSLKLALDAANLLLKRKSVIFLISDFLEDKDNYRKVLASTNKKHDVVAIDLTDPLENEIPKVGLLAFHDAETKREVWINSSDENWKKSFNQKRMQFEESKSHLFKSTNVDRIKFTTEEDYVSRLTHFFKERVKRR